MSFLSSHAQTSSKVEPGGGVDATDTDRPKNVLSRPANCGSEIDIEDPSGKRTSTVRFSVTATSSNIRPHRFGRFTLMIFCVSSSIKAKGAIPHDTLGTDVRPVEFLTKHRLHGIPAY